jgi:hypothetical protein
MLDFVENIRFRFAFLLDFVENIRFRFAFLIFNEEIYRCRGKCRGDS